LIKALGSEEMWVYNRAVLALTKIGEPAVPELRKALGNKKASIRANAAWVLGNLGLIAKDAVPDLINALRDKSEWVKKKAADALEMIGAPEAAKVVEAARQELKILKEKRIQSLTRKLESEKASVRLDAVAALHDSGPAAVPALIKALKDEDEEVRLDVVQALIFIGEPAKDIISALVETFLNDRNEKVRTWAASGLGSHKFRSVANDVVPILIGALSDKNESTRIRVSAILALGRLGNPDAIPVLSEKLSDENERVRCEAGKALKNIGTPEAVKLVEEYERKN